MNRVLKRIVNGLSLINLCITITPLISLFYAVFLKDEQVDKDHIILIFNLNIGLSVLIFLLSFISIKKEGGKKSILISLIPVIISILLICKTDSILFSFILLILFIVSLTLMMLNQKKYKQVL